MNIGKTLFAQLMEFVPWTSFARIVARYPGDLRVSTLSCTAHFRIMVYAQLICRESLRDIEATLGANATKLIRWDCVNPCVAPLWPMPTSGATGASGMLPPTEN